MHPTIGIATLEFADTGSLDKSALLARLDEVMDLALRTISGLVREQLAKEYEVQCHHETGVAIIVHVTEHFSYHVGQVTLHTKLVLDVDTGYYAGQDHGFYAITKLAAKTIELSRK